MIKSHHSQFLLYTLIVVLFTANFLNAGGKNAAVAMALCVIPGGGQFYTERYLAGVAIGGITVSRASLHNFDFITERDIRLGDVVRVHRAGDVIPYIVGPVIERIERRIVAVTWQLEAIEYE